MQQHFLEQARQSDTLIRNEIHIVIVIRVWWTSASEAGTWASTSFASRLVVFRATLQLQFFSFFAPKISINPACVPFFIEECTVQHL